MSRLKKIIKTIDFIKYISKPVEKKDINLIYKINGITQEKSELMCDFVSTLFQTVYTTYMGDNLMSKNDQIKHFKWCWNKVLVGFGKELIFFNKSGMFYEYLSNLMLETFYRETDKSEKNTENTLYFIINSFNYSKIKTKSELDNFIDLYKIFNKSFSVGV
tara:strand:- start:47 stop:529 length:483 start_codon:yes stop_codon:yes gene_type:complete